MGCDTVFRRLVHLLGTDLDLKGLPRRPHQRRVERLVHVRLRHGDVILKTSRDRGVHLMDHTQRRVAVLYRVHDDPHGEQVVHLVQRLVLVHHLLIYTEEMLHPAVDLRLDVCILHMLCNFRHDLLDELLALGLPLVQVLHQLIVDIRLPVFKREVIELRLDLRYTEPPGDGRVNVHRLPCLLLLLGRRHKLQRAHIVEPVRKLDDNDTDILGHGQEHFP